MLSGSERPRVEVSACHTPCLSEMEIISSPPSTPCCIAGFCVTHRSKIPTRARQDFSLTRSVFSIIHEKCLLFFLDPAQYISHSMVPLPCIRVCRSNEGALSISNCSVAPAISHRECHCYISFEFYKHYHAWVLSSKCVY